MSSFQRSTLNLTFQFLQTTKPAITVQHNLLDNVRNASHWTNNLLRELNDPTKWILWNNEIVVITDRYPKAKYHFLVLPRDNIQSIFDLSQSHIKLLNRMYHMAIQAILIHALPRDIFQIGYHAKPSLNQLHLHVISTDFNSQTMKTIKHWNSFTTELFITHHTIIERLTKCGRIDRLKDNIYKALSDGTPLRCHICCIKQPTMAHLKHHLLTHNLN